MKKLLLIVTALCLVFTMVGSTAHALTVGSPTGSSTGDWFKDSFSVSVSHGVAPVLGLLLGCSGAGTSWSSTYTSTNSGTHTYTFYADSTDDPYISIDGGTRTPYDHHCSGSTSTETFVTQFIASVDSQAPFINITIPGSSTSTSATSYTVSGSVSDPEGDLKTVQAKVNDVLGPTGSVSGTTYSVKIPISKGANTVQMIATDGVGHTASSGTVTITSTASSASSGGSSGSSSGSSSSTGASTSSSTGSTSASDALDNSTSPLLFDSKKLITVTDPTLANKAPSPEDVQETASLSGATGFGYIALVLIIVILLGLSGYVVWRSRPIFAELSHEKRGLRRRIIIIVTLPSLIPLIGLGYLGYQQLSNSTKSQLSDQLQKAAQVSAVKLDREFTIRRTIITKTASDILQIKGQYQAQQDQLDEQKANCQQLVQTAVPAGQYNKLSSSADCLPFLASFAQLRSSTRVTDFVNALSAGANQAKSDLVVEENERVNESLSSVRDYFPDVLELAIVDNSNTPVVKALLPRANGGTSTISTDHKDLVAQAAKKNLALYQTKGNDKELLLTYPITSGDSSLGGVVVSFDTQNLSFIPSIWQATPKPYSTDQVFFLTTEGQVVTDSPGAHASAAAMKLLAKTSTSTVSSLTLPDQKYTARTATVTSVNWVVAVATPASSVLAPLAGVQQTALMAIIGFALLSLLLGIWFASSIVGEIRYLFLGARAFAKGDLDYRINLVTHDELQVLGNTMNQMADDIKEAQAALVQKDKEFISMATHELKAPMTAIIGYMSMIIDDGMGSVDDTARRFIREAYAGTIRLRDIVTDMLDVARLESGHAEFKLESLSVQDLTEAVISIQKIQADLAGVALMQKPGPTLPKVVADSNKLQIILTNFVSNAIKYNQKGGSVTISHGLRDGKLVTAVADDGLGIPADQQSHIFEKFYRVKNDDRAKVPGTGLGMYITKEFVEKMGGEVWFDSEHGKGTTFYFSLPLEQATPPTKPEIDNQ